MNEISSKPFQDSRLGGNPAWPGVEPSEQALLTYAKEGPVGEAMQLQCLHLFAELVQETVEELEATEKKGFGGLFQLKVIVRVQISDPPLRIVAGAPGQVPAAEDERLQQRPLGLLRRRSALQRGLHRPCAPPPPGLQAAGGLRRVGARFPELTPRRPHHLLIVRVQADGAGSPQDKVRGARTHLATSTTSPRRRCGQPRRHGDRETRMVSVRSRQPCALHVQPARMDLRVA